MTYWDASALVPLLITEAATNTVQSWLREDANVVTWVWTRVEITSAIERRYREGDPGGKRFACLDHRLAKAAELEGFTVLNTAS